MKLYTVVECIPSRIIGLANLLTEIDGKGYTRAEVIDLLQPAALRKGADADPDMSNKVIGAARELGLIEEYDHDTGEKCIRITKDAAPPRSRHLHWERWIARRVLRDLVDSDAQNLATVVAWLQTVRLTDAPTDRVGWKVRFEKDGFDLYQFGLNNDARWDNVFDWSRFVGLLWQTRTGRDAPGIVCDPAVLLTRFLDEILPDRDEVTAADFRARLGVVFPPLDGGHIFRAVRQRVAAARGETTDDTDRLSPGLGMALRELRDRKLLSFHCPDDQRTFLLFDDGERVAFVSREKRIA
jgi:hypothetical protein